MLAEAIGQEVVTPVKSRGSGDGGAGRGVLQAEKQHVSES